MENVTTPFGYIALHPPTHVGNGCSSIFHPVCFEWECNTMTSDGDIWHWWVGLGMVMLFPIRLSSNNRFIYHPDIHGLYKINLEYVCNKNIIQRGHQIPKKNEPLKAKSCHDANIVIIGGTAGCLYDNLWCHYWRQSWHCKSSVTIDNYNLGFWQQI